MTTVQIREPRDDDLDRIRDLLREEDLPQEDISDHIDRFTIAEIDNRLVGFVGYELYGTVALVRSLVVVPGYRGRGLGGLLLEEMEHQLQRIDVEELYLLTTNAGSYFENRGFHTIPRQLSPEAIQQSRQYTSLCPTSAAVMKKTISLQRH